MLIQQVQGVNWMYKIVIQLEYISPKWHANGERKFYELKRKEKKREHKHFTKALMILKMWNFCINNDIDLHK